MSRRAERSLCGATLAEVRLNWRFGKEAGAGEGRQHARGDWWWLGCWGTNWPESC